MTERIALFADFFKIFNGNTCEIEKRIVSLQCNKRIYNIHSLIKGK